MNPIGKLEQRLLVLGSTRQEGEVASRILADAGIDCPVCRDAPHLLDELARGAGALLLADQVLSAETLQRLGQAIGAQANWSDLPILILTDPGANSPVVHHALQRLHNVEVIERPLRVATLTRMARSALRSRERQYQMRAAQKTLLQSDERFRIVADLVPLPMKIHAEDGEILQVNRAWKDITGYSLSDTPTIDAWLKKALGEQDVSARREIDQIYGITQTRLSEEYVIRCKDGRQRVWQFSSAPLGRLADGRRAVISMAVDLTERKDAEGKLKLAAMVYQESSEAMMMTDANNRIILLNSAFERITGYRASDVIGASAGFLRSSRDSKFHYREMLRHLAQHRYWKGELRLKRKSDENFAAAVTINTLVAPEGTGNRHVVLFSDISEKKGADELIWQQANFDTLTGLPNRSMFHDDLKREISKASRHDQHLALMCLDLDGFKQVNDSLGHDMGDQLLREAAARLRRCVRAIDVVARLGDDEFTVILSELHGSNGAERVAETILLVLAEPYHLGGQAVHVSASIGITLYPHDADSIDDLIKNADQAMYAAKQGGRNGYRYFTQSMQDAAQTRMRTINDLRTALDGEQFLVRYQPIVELATRKIRKAEALIRWQHPTRGVIGPDQFIATAEDIGMMAEFGDWVFRKAATQAARWRARYAPDFQVSVNISPVQFKEAGINVAAWLAHLNSLNLSGRGIVAEITEGLLLDANASTTDKLLAFRDAGIEVALDDFGTGYSALSYLKKFAIDYIKIDQSFVRNLAPGSSDLALCEAIIVMAHKLSIKVIAEGIESRQQCALLSAAGCDYGQGYLFSRPLSAAQLDQTLNGKAAKGAASS